MPVKIPRYIYHLTNASNYSSILKDGVIKRSHDELLGKGVFATELENFFKHWTKSKDWSDFSLQEELIKQISKGESDIVILRIPTAGLDTNKLFVRSQNRLFSWSFNTDVEKVDKAIESMEQNAPNSKAWIEKMKEIFNDIISKERSKECANHLTKGAPALSSPLYKQRKEAIEFVYLDDIPLTKAQKIGEANLDQVKNAPEYDPFRPIKSLFAKLLSGTPEEKSVAHIKY